MALIAARVPRYISMFASWFEGASDATFAELFNCGLDLSCVVGVDSMTSASNGKRSSRFASHSQTSSVRVCVVKKGARRASCVKGRRNHPPVRLSNFFRILTSPIEDKRTDFSNSNGLHLPRQHRFRVKEHSD